MSSRLARIRAAATALGVVLTIAFVVFSVIAIAGLTVGYVWGTVFSGGDSGPETPTIEFETAYDDGEVLLTHAGGDEADPTNVVIEIDGTNRGTWADFGDEATVTEGESIVVDDVERGESLTIWWVSGLEPFVLEETTI
ncbi:hypothetical protein [Halovivax gelatinilyticus]|uniref:hypothetical protein n=1 Tax=Halovivax gelatinilyticus TaxID=2961597 RepID=UPI0020CA913E|nr:hypothetical protein [Halovivax gelatinilyticus]